MSSQVHAAPVSLPVRAGGVPPVSRPAGGAPVRKPALRKSSHQRPASDEKLRSLMDIERYKFSIWRTIGSRHRVRIALIRPADELRRVVLVPDRAIDQRNAGQLFNHDL